MDSPTSSTGTKSSVGVLHSPLFLLSLVTLLLNDWYLKQQFHNWLTGKLSDIAGLVLFFLFIYAFLPKYRTTILSATSITFIYWKSTASQGLIDWCNTWLSFPLSRTVDYTDNLALLALLWAHYYAPRLRPRVVATRWRVPLILLSLGAITGTSAPPQLTKEELELEARLDQITEEQVSTFQLRRNRLQPETAARLEKLLATLPDLARLQEKGVKAAQWDSDSMAAITYEFPQFYINTWVFHLKPGRVTEYNISPWQSCVRQIATGNANAAIPFLGAHIEFLRDGEKVLLKKIKIELCDIPERRDIRQAMDYFLSDITGVIEESFYE